MLDGCGVSIELLVQRETQRHDMNAFEEMMREAYIFDAVQYPRLSLSLVFTTLHSSKLKKTGSREVRSEQRSILCKSCLKSAFPASLKGRSVQRRHDELFLCPPPIQLAFCSITSFQMTLKQSAAPHAQNEEIV